MPFVHAPVKGFGYLMMHAPRMDQENSSSFPKGLDLSAETSPSAIQAFRHFEAWGGEERACRTGGSSCPKGDGLQPNSDMS